ncbi:MAG: translation initiation factor [bacterium]
MNIRKGSSIAMKNLGLLASVGIALALHFLCDYIFDRTFFAEMGYESMDSNRNSKLVYSTDAEVKLKKEQGSEPRTLPPQQQHLKISIDKTRRKGKTVTLVSGFVGAKNDLAELGKLLKSRCGVGGTVKNGQILIQGDFRGKIIEILCTRGYKVKRTGG